MAATPEPSLTTLAAALACGAPGCACAHTARRGHGMTHCPAHDDRRPSLSLDGRHGTVLMFCHAGCPQQAVLAALRQRGLWGDHHTTPARVVAFELRDPDGQLVAIHLRSDLPHGGKRFTWRLPDGTPSLGGRRVVDLPLYGVERLRDVPATEPVVVVEGEKACHALLGLGIAAVGTVTGAAATPSDASLRPLLRFATIALWPDNDRAGEQHMQRIAQRLRALGHHALRRVVWADAPPAGDAADVPDAATVQRLIASAVPWQDAPDVPAPDAPAVDGRDHASAAPRSRRESRAAALLEQAQANVVELWHAPTGEAYATIDVAGVQQHVPLDSHAFDTWLARLSHQLTGQIAGAQDLQSVKLTLAGDARFAGAQHPVFVRVAEHGGSVFVDLGDATGRAVAIDAAGWRVVAQPPVRFVRPGGLLPLPEPQHGGSLEALRPLLNLQDSDDWRLLAGWLVGALCPRGPYPLLLLHGQQGSGKSSAARLLQGLIDPRAVPLRAEPRELRDLMITAKHTWCVGFDNISQIQPWLSDALCRLATGGGLGVRRLYTDSDEIQFDAQRPVLVTAISEVITRGDLLDRTLLVRLAHNPDEIRRLEREVLSEYERLRPALLGALFDCISSALRHEAAVRASLRSLPRLADWAIWATAGLRALGWDDTELLEAVRGRRAEADAIALEASPLGPLLVRLGLAPEGWQGTAEQLRRACAALAAEDEVPAGTFQRDELIARRVEQLLTKAAGWPRSGRGVRAVLDQLAPHLRAEGVTISYLRHGRRGRVIVLTPHHRQKEREAAEPSHASQPSPGPDVTRAAGGKGGDGCAAGGDGCAPAPTPPPRVTDARCDGGADGDGCAPPFHRRQADAADDADDSAAAVVTSHAVVPATCEGCGGDARQGLLQVVADGWGVACTRCNFWVTTLCPPALQDDDTLQLVLAREGRDARGRPALLVVAAPVSCPHCQADLLQPALLGWADEQTLCCGACDAVVAVLPPLANTGLRAEAAP